MHFVFDLDGTICFQGKPLSSKIIDALQEVTHQGHEVVFASARPIRDMLPVIHPDLHGYAMIGGNGSLISKQGEIVYSQGFSPQEMNDIMSLIGKYNATYLIDSEWDYAYTGPQDHPILNNVDPDQLAKRVHVEELTSIVKILILTSDSFEELSARLTELDVFVNRHRHEHVLDISPKGIHKWSALQTLGVQERSYIAFGNDANDITMFEHAKHAVMIGYYEPLSSSATEAIELVDDYEQKIVDKIQELSRVAITR
ncbi:HAD family hydrolase [Paenibacillus selenitireducens]|uniref:HAD family hydrolase n=1 Tax=Paenibacillus selenitireducens TaxID=1324314 RepID=A0A1T2XMV6_9BACL|nr:HAD-IIB family hydrolase [Paenibacillus selenitireducens]OPA81191.1 HAD family hydrolase [Paenibacillus selenitireducens]